MDRSSSSVDRFRYFLVFWKALNAYLTIGHQSLEFRAPTFTSLGSGDTPPPPGGLGYLQEILDFTLFQLFFGACGGLPPIRVYPSFVPICKDRNNDHIIVNIENKIITKCHSFGCTLHPRTHLKCDLWKQERETNSLNRCYRALKTDQRIQLTEIKLMSYQRLKSPPRNLEAHNDSQNFI